MKNPPLNSRYFGRCGLQTTLLWLGNYSMNATHREELRTLYRVAINTSPRNSGGSQEKGQNGKKERKEQKEIKRKKINHLKVP